MIEQEGQAARMQAAWADERNRMCNALLEQAKSLQDGLKAGVERAHERVQQDYLLFRKTHAASLLFYNQIQAALHGANAAVFQLEAALTPHKEDE